MLALIRKKSFILLLISTWIVLLLSVGVSELINVFEQEWDISLTMLFASFVAGATSLGGGAVAFPVLTKLLEVTPHNAMLFSIAIQSIGMTAASILIFSKNIKAHYQLIPVTFLGSIIGFSFSYFFLRPVLAPSSVKYMFTMFSILVAISLLIKVSNKVSENRLSNQHEIKKSYLLSTGVIGGLITSFIGTGADFVFFTLLSFIYSYDIKSSTASSVILMALTSIYASVLIFVTTDVYTTDIQLMWLAAIPVVILGAPLGAYFCKKVDEKITVCIVFVLVLAESTSTFILVPIVKQTFILMSMAALICMMFIWVVRKNKSLNKKAKGSF